MCKHATALQCAAGAVMGCCYVVWDADNKCTWRVQLPQLKCVASLQPCCMLLTGIPYVQPTAHCIKHFAVASNSAGLSRCKCL